MKAKKKPQAKRYYLFQRLARWVRDTTVTDTRAFTNGGLIGDINAFSRKDALEQAVEKYPDFRGTIEVREWGEPIGEDKWYPCLEETE